MTEQEKEPVTLWTNDAHLSDRDQFAIGFATSLLELDNVPLTEDGKQKLKVKFDLYKQSLTKNR